MIFDGENVFFWKHTWLSLRYWWSVVVFSLKAFTSVSMTVCMVVLALWQTDILTDRHSQVCNPEAPDRTCGFGSGLRLSAAHQMRKLLTHRRSPVAERLSHIFGKKPVSYILDKYLWKSTEEQHGFFFSERLAVNQSVFASSAEGKGWQSQKL